MADEKSIGAFPQATTLDGSEQLLGRQLAATKLLPVAQLPVSVPQTTAIAIAKADLQTSLAAMQSQLQAQIAALQAQIQPPANAPTYSAAPSLSPNGVAIGGTVTINKATINGGGTPVTAGTTRLEVYVGGILRMTISGAAAQATNPTFDNAAAWGGSQPIYVRQYDDWAGGVVSVPSATITSAAAASLTLTLQQPSMTVVQGVPFAKFKPAAASGGTAPLVYSITPSLPSGCAFDTATGEISFVTDSGNYAPQTPTIHSIGCHDSAGPPNNAVNSVQFTFEVTASAAATPLARAPWPAFLAVSKNGATEGGSWTGTTDITGSDGVKRLSQVADPGGSTKQVYLHRVVQGDTQIASGVRCEVLWIDKPAVAMVRGQRYIMAFAVRLKGDETMPPSSADDSLLVFQCKANANGSTWPVMSLGMSKQSGQIWWTRSWQTAPYVSADVGNHAEGESYDHTEALPAVDTWWAYIVEYTPHWDVAANPYLRVSRSKAGAAFEELFVSAGPNDYNVTDQVGPYPRIGTYKFTPAVWNGATSIAFYLTPLYFGQGADRFSEAAAALAGIGGAAPGGGGGGGGGGASGYVAGNVTSGLGTGLTHDLAVEGATDWITYPAGDSTSVRKNTTARVSLALGGGASYGGGETAVGRTKTWTGGTPTASGSHTAAVPINKATAGAQAIITVTGVGTTPEVLDVLVGAATSLSIVAHLSDGSAADFVWSGMPLRGRVQITFNAATAAQTLTLTITNTDNADNMTIEAASLRPA